MYVCVFGICVGVLVEAGCVHSTQKPEDSLGLELQMLVSHNVVAGNQTRILWKSSQCSQLLGHLSSPSGCKPCRHWESNLGHLEEPERLLAAGFRCLLMHCAPQYFVHSSPLFLSDKSVTEEMVHTAYYLISFRRSFGTGYFHCVVKPRF